MMGKIRGSVNMRAAKAWAAKYDEKLTGTDKRFNHLVVLRDQHEVTTRIIEWAFAVEIKVGTDAYICVFSEHHDTIVVNKDEVFVTQYQKHVEVPKIARLKAGK
jgi:hypothetical protein